MTFFSIFKSIDARRDLHENLIRFFDQYLTSDMDVYDIGCGFKPFADILKGKVKSHVGVDIEDGFYDASHIDLVGTAYEVPVENGVADAIISSQVLEHLERPVDATKEAARILKKDGVMLLSFPFLYPMHAEPHDYSRITEFNIEKILSDEGFEILETKRIGGFWYLAGIFTGIYLQPINRGVLKKTKIAVAFLWLIRWVFYLIHSFEGTVLKLLKKSPENLRKKWTVNYVIVARKK